MKKEKYTKYSKRPIGFMRGVSIEICKDGIVSVRVDSTQQRRLNAALPMYSVSTVERAEQLIVLLCSTVSTPLGTEYLAPQWTGKVEDIDRVGGLFAHWDNKIS